MSFMFIAHRGASADATDNTFEAFELAIDQKADLIETDVQITLDGVLVLEHDLQIGQYPISACRLDELRSLNPQSVTVAAALARFGNRIPFCWEIKAPGCETTLVTMVKDLTPSPIWSLTEFTSFNFGTAAHLAQLVPENMTGWLTNDWNEEVILKAKDAGLKQICPKAADVLANPKLVGKASDNGLVVRVWKVQAAEMIPGLIEAGVYGGTVNWPAAARKAVS